MNRIQFGSLIFSLMYEFSKMERKMSSNAGLYSGQPRVLTILKFNEGCTLSELSDICGIGMPSLSVSVRNMEKSGLLRREISGSDGRVQKIYLTEEGYQRAEMFHEEIDAFYSEFLGSLSEEKIDKLAEHLELMKDTFAGYNEKQHS
ncbi:MAG: MarR family transcriptional regulator [Ruminococcaceae bacterium]|nr:MarR family transcriptional regulator [Oscillospiraceae bacterium]